MCAHWLGCAVLLLQAYRQSRYALLLWSGLCFVGLTVSNALRVPRPPVPASHRLVHVALGGGAARHASVALWVDLESGLRCSGDQCCPARGHCDGIVSCGAVLSAVLAEDARPLVSLFRGGVLCGVALNRVALGVTTVSRETGTVLLPGLGCLRLWTHYCWPLSTKTVSRSGQGTRHWIRCRSIIKGRLREVDRHTMATRCTRNQTPDDQGPLSESTGQLRSGSSAAP